MKQMARRALKLKSPFYWLLAMIGSTFAFQLFALLLFSDIFAFALGRAMTLLEQIAFFSGAIGLMAFSLWILKKT